MRDNLVYWPYRCVCYTERKRNTMLTELFTGWLGRPTLVAEDDTWALLALMCVTVALAVWLEQRYAWASKVSGALIALLVALAASNLAIIPNSCVLYDDIVWNFAVPMGIPLLLLQCNMKKIWREIPAFSAISARERSSL